MYYIKDFLERCVYFYEKDETYRRSSKKILLYFVIISIICLSINFFDKEWLESFGIGEISYFVISLSICIIRLIVQILYSFVTIPSDYIEHDMDKMPDKIGKCPVVIQYDPPKWLNPSEVWMLYNQSCESTNLDCLLYKREYEWLIDIEDKGNWNVILYRNKGIDSNAPSYERQYWTMIFGFDCKDRVMWKLQQAKLDVKELSNLHSELLRYCVEKWRLYNERLKISGLFSILICILLTPIFPPLWIVVILYFYAVAIYYSNKKSIHFGTTNLRNRIHLTEGWEKLLAHIIGYKYWLEHCEEKQLKKILKEDSSFNNKTLPYVIALRMDWKFLDKKFNK